MKEEIKFKIFLSLLGVVFICYAIGTFTHFKNLKYFGVGLFAVGYGIHALKTGTLYLRGGQYYRSVLVSRTVGLICILMGILGITMVLIEGPFVIVK